MGGVSSAEAPKGCRVDDLAQGVGGAGRRQRQGRAEAPAQFKD
jgi:hypothetical protein